MEKTKETLRTTALAWWKNLSDMSVYRLTGKYNYQGRRNRVDLTGKEIEEIWRKETAYKMQVETNQKQYSQEEVDRLLDQQAAKTANQILKNSTYGADSKNHPINRKQFVEFNESLFKAYIDKFSDEDKVKAHQTLWKSLDFKTQNEILEAICNPNDFD